MDWIAIGAIGEFVGGVVVIVTVVYLALQLRNSNQLAKASCELEWVHGLNEIWDRWSRPEVIDAIRSGFHSFDDLNQNQQVIFQMQVGSLVNHLQTALQLTERRLLPNSFEAIAEDLLVMILSTKGGLQYWEIDSKATPGGEERLRRVKTPDHPTPTFDELFPWWREKE